MSEHLKDWLRDWRYMVLPYRTYEWLGPGRGCSDKAAWMRPDILRRDTWLRGARR